MVRRRPFCRPVALALAAAVWLGGCGGETEPETSTPPFEEVAEQSGLRFTHSIGSSGEYYLPEIMGSGVALLDYDSDGDLDVYLIQGAALHESSYDGDVKQGELRNRLFANQLTPSGKLTFVDVTDEAGLGHPGYGMGVAVGDYDNDGDPDLFVTNFGRNVLYRNDGGRFTDVTTPSLEDERWSASAAFLDYDLDGDLDLFFTNYVDFTTLNNKACQDSTGARDYCTPMAYNPVPDKLFRNDKGRFVDVTIEAGLDAAYGNGLGVTVADFNNDNLPDIYVANDATANQLWTNLGGGRFENTALMAGAAYNSDGLAEAGMGVSAADFDGDGDEDLFMTHLSQETNTLYMNNGRGDFRDQTDRFGLGASSTPFTGFGMQWIDYDLDGLLDLFIANGGVTIEESQRGDAYPFRQANQLFHRTASEFENVSADAGPALALAEVSRGAAFGDIDRDGDTDVVVANNNGPARLYLNRAGDDRPWVRIRVRGTEANRDGYGARVALLIDDQEPIWRRIHSDGSYLSASEPVAVFGLSAPDVRMEGVGVIWPRGARERFPAPALNSVTELVQGEGVPWN